jgi:lipid A 3-O-deacylase
MSPTSPIFSGQQATANKHNIYHGIILILAVILAILRSPLEVYAQEVELPQRTIPQDLITSPVSPQASPIEPDQADSPQLPAQSEATFGTKGQKHWYVQGAAATTVDREEAFPQRFALAGAGLSKFLFNGHSINLELNTIYFSQPDDDALGLNLALLMRWHFLRKPNWSLFIDGGAGVMVTTSDVPSKGASFNFTPQAGAGVNIKLKEQKRLMLGLRWHHISHADLFGANPGRDSIMGYVGVQFPR